MSVRRRAILIITGVFILAIGVWWWHWQAPYRTLIAFLYALENGDVKAMYELTPKYERRFVKPELIQFTYRNFIKPQFLTGRRLVRIQRTSLRRPFLPELILTRVRVVRFYLWFRGKDNKEILTAVIVQRPPNERRWKVPFSTFVFNTCLGLLLVDSQQKSDVNLKKVDRSMASLGFKWVATPTGSITWIVPE